MNYDILIFIQAAADLRYAVDLIDKNKEKKIHLYVIHVKSIYDFACSLPFLNVKIDFQDYFEIKVKNPITYLKAKRNLYLYYREGFLSNNYKKVYFFSRFYDAMTFSMLGRLGTRLKTEIIYVDHYDTASVINDIEVPKFSICYFKNKYIALVFSFVSGVSIISKYRKRYLEFEYAKYQIKKVEPNKNIKVIDDFKYKAPRNPYKKAIIFLLSPEELNMITQTSVDKLKDILTQIRELGYESFVKGHPRLGTPIELLKYFDKEIPSYIPAEFIDYEDYSITIGIMSSGLVYPSQIEGNRTFSIMNLLEFKNRDDSLFYRSFLKEHSKGYVKFVNDMDWQTLT